MDEYYQLIHPRFVTSHDSDEEGVNLYTISEAVKSNLNYWIYYPEFVADVHKELEDYGTACLFFFELALELNVNLLKVHPLMLKLKEEWSEFNRKDIAEGTQGIEEDTRIRSIKLLHSTPPKNKGKSTFISGEKKKAVRRPTEKISWKGNEKKFQGMHPNLSAEEISALESFSNDLFCKLSVLNKSQRKAIIDDVSQLVANVQRAKNTSDDFSSTSAGTPAEDITAGTPAEKNTAGTSAEENTANKPVEDITAGTPAENITAGTSVEDNTAGRSTADDTAGTPTEDNTAIKPVEEDTADTPTASASTDSITCGASTAGVFIVPACGPSFFTPEVLPSVSGKSDKRGRSKAEAGAEQRNQVVKLWSHEEWVNIQWAIANFYYRYT